MSFRQFRQLAIISLALLTQSPLIATLKTPLSTILTSSRCRSHHDDHHCCTISSCTSLFLHPSICSKTRITRLRPLLPSISKIRDWSAFSLAASSMDEDDSRDSSDDSSNPLPMISRCSSRDAASILQNMTTHEKENNNDDDDNDGLLLITCDASGRGGGSKHDGIAAILRIIQNTDAPSSKEYINAFARRTIPSRKSSEVAAIALGIKRALRSVPPSLRKRILILSDSEYALDFFCGSGSGDDPSGDATTAAAATTTTSTRQQILGGNNNQSNQQRQQRKKRKGRGGRTRSTTSSDVERRERAHRRSLLSLAKETPRGITFARVRSSSRGVGTMTSNNNDDGEAQYGWDGVGFIDHDAADYLSSVTRSFPNVDDNNDDEYDNENKIHSFDDDMEGLMTLFGFSATRCLTQDDFAWLANSDIIVQRTTTTTTNRNGRGGQGSSSSGNNDKFWKAIKVVGSDMREDRRERNRRRTNIIREMLGNGMPSSLVDG